jgi:transcriptional regulator with XRE-family HTH domain
MSHLSQTLKKLLRELDMSPAELARTCKLHESQVSRILNGKTVNIDKTTLEILSRAFSPIYSAEVVAAYLMDKKLPHVQGSEFVKISVQAGSKGGKPRPVMEVSPRLERAMTYLMEHAGHSKTLEDMLVLIAENNGLKHAA